MANWLRGTWAALFVVAACGGSGVTQAPNTAPHGAATERADLHPGAVHRAEIAGPPQSPDGAPLGPLRPYESPSEPLRPDVRAEPETDVWLGAEAMSDSLLYGHTQQQVAIWVNVPPAMDAPRLPTTLTMTVDTSGSMRGKKLPAAQEAARTVLDRLADGDIVALHSFSDSVRELFGLTELDARSRQHLAWAVDRMRANGSTSLFEAARRAIDVAAAAPPSHPVRRVILISDGRATSGPASPSTLGQLAERGADRGVQITALGIGLDYDERTLNALAQRSSGRLYHVESSYQLAGIIERELALLQRSRATDAYLEVVPAPDVVIDAPSFYRASSGPGRALRIPLGSVFAGQEREFIVRLRLRSGWTGRRALLSVRLHYVDPAEGGLARVQETVVRCNLTEDEGLVRRSANPRAQAIASAWEAAELASEASQAANSGDFNGADARLQQAESRLHESARKTRSASLRQRYEQSARRLGAARSKVGQARSAPPAKRRSTSRAAALESNDAAMDVVGY